LVHLKKWSYLQPKGLARRRKVDSLGQVIEGETGDGAIVYFSILMKLLHVDGGELGQEFVVNLWKSQVIRKSHEGTV
jgi:hypothetical protein